MTVKVTGPGTCRLHRDRQCPLWSPEGQGISGPACLLARMPGPQASPAGRRDRRAVGLVQRCAARMREPPPRSRAGGAEEHRRPECLSSPERGPAVSSKDGRHPPGRLLLQYRGKSSCPVHVKTMDRAGCGMIVMSGLTMTEMLAYNLQTSGIRKAPVPGRRPARIQNPGNARGRRAGWSSGSPITRAG